MAAARQFTQRYLAPGARVELIAPASPFDAADFERGVARLAQHYTVHYRPDILERQGYLAGSDQRRLAELEAALAQPQVDAIIAARGGFGVTRLLDRLDAAAIRRRAPLLVGFSDITALHALWARAEVASVHGNMVAAIGRSEELQFERWRAALEGRFPDRLDDLTCLAPGVAEGILLGGNLTVLTALLGTPHFPPLTEAVLFLEDVGERPYRVDRMLTTWRNAGAFDGVLAIALGAFVQGDPGPDATTLSEVLSERLVDLGIPIVAGVPAGHLDDNAELPFGRRITLDATAGHLYLHERRNS